MAKQILKVTDFTGGVNSYSDPRDIQDNQFAQNWNAALDRTGIVRYSGGGIKSITNLPQDNTNQINGFGLFRFTTDYSFNILDSDFNAGIERGTIAAVNSSTTATLEETDSLVISTDDSNDDYYNNMSILIYSGTGAGQTRQITDYDASTKIITHDEFSTGLSTSSKYIIFPWYPDGTNFGFQADANWITDGSGTGLFPSGVDSTTGNETGDYYLVSKTATIDDNNFKNQGHIQYNKALTIKPGVNYTLSFDCRAQRRWLNYVADGAVDGSVAFCDQVPWIYLYNSTLKLGLVSNGESSFFVDTTNSPAYSLFERNYIDNGDFDDAFTEGWNTQGSDIGTPAEEGTAGDSYGETAAGTATLTSDASFTFDTEPSSYLYSDNIALIEEMHYHLNFVYASTDGVAYSVYDATSSTYIIPWTTKPSSGGSTEYRYVNQEVDNFTMFGKKQTKYITFQIPLNGTASDGNSTRNIQIRFAPVKSGSTARIAGVTLRKAVCDLNTMSYFGSGANPFLGDHIKEWSTYSLKFKLPETGDADGRNISERNDWVLRLYAGMATRRDGGIDNESTQSVYFDNIRLVEEHPDTITLLKDNKTTGSFITMYSESKSNWDTKFIKWDGLKSEPNYDYVNGMLKISDGNFANNNNNFLVYRYDRKFMNKYFNYEWVSQQYCLPSAPNTIVTSESQDGISGTTFNCIDYVNKLYSGLEYKNANKPVDTYLNSEGQLVRGMQTDSNTEWSFGRFTNWDMDEIDKGILQRYAWNNHSGSSYYGANNVNPPGGYTGGQQGYKDGEDISNPVAEGNLTADGALHATIRGIRSQDNNGHCLSTWSHNPVCFWIQGEDVVNTEDDMISKIGANKKIAKLSIRFTHEFQLSQRYGANNNTDMHTGELVYYKVRAWKADNPDLQTDARTQVTYNGIANQDITFQQLAADSYGMQEGTEGGTDAIPDIFRVYSNEELDVDERSSLREIYIGKNDSDAGKSFTSNNLEELHVNYTLKVNNNLTTKGEITAEGELTWTQAANLTSNDDIFITVEEVWQHAKRYTRSYAYRHSNADHFEGTTSGHPYADIDSQETFAKYSKIKINKMDLHFYQDDYDENVNNVQSLSDDVCHANFNFSSPDGVDATGWGEKIFRLATTSVNIFGEESGLNENKLQEIGTASSGAGTITLGHAPTLTLHVASSILQDKYKTHTKFYMKGTDSDIWYLQFFVDHKTGLLHSTTSSKKIAGVIQPNKNSTMWTMPRESIASFNEVNSYESETGILQENAITPNNAELDCRYKTSVVANNRLYVGNIMQNGTIYGDRMIKSPINKYNILPSTNFIDVAINDGDEITGLAYYKDKLLQYKKRKVFVINTSADYEYLEDTFDNIGVQRQCQIVTTPMGIAWANSSGCFLYDGQQIMNLIDNKLGTESFQSGINNNYWTISDSDIPVIGYIKSTKKLIVSKNAESHTINAVPTMWQFDFISQGWTFLFQKQKVQTDNTAFAPSNFINDENGDLLWYSNDGNAIYKWSDSPVTNTHSNANLDNFILITKDYDFGNPSVRKKIHKVYVTFKSVDDSNGSGSKTAAHSNIKAYFATNGNLNSWTPFDDSSVNYNDTNGLSDGASSLEWIQAELKPSSSINNIYSFALKFEGGATNIPNGFEINDFSIVYRIKRVK